MTSPVWTRECPKAHGWYYHRWSNVAKWAARLVLTEDVGDRLQVRNPIDDRLYYVEEFAGEWAGPPIPSPELLARVREFLQVVGDEDCPENGERGCGCDACRALGLLSDLAPGRGGTAWLG